jgi:hypothetical protein
MTVRKAEVGTRLLHDNLSVAAARNAGPRLITDWGGSRGCWNSWKSACGWGFTGWQPTC